MLRTGSKSKGLSLLVTMLASAALLLSGCDGGSNGSTGATGATGATGPTGPAGPAGVATVQADQATPDQWAALSLTGSVTSVDMSKGTPVVKFKVTDSAGNPVTGLAANTTKSSTALLTSYANVALTIAKLVPAYQSANTSDGYAKWVNYVVTSTPSTTTAAIPAKPSTDSVGSLVDNGGGSYTYTFYRDVTKAKDQVAAMAAVTLPNDKADLGDLTYDPSLTHRVVIQIGGNARGTGTNTANAVQVVAGVGVKNPANIIYDFIPATGKPVAATDTQREVVSVDKCNSCHTRFVVHGGSRVDTRFCVTCHTDQRKYGNAEATTTATGYSGNTYKINGRAVGEFPNLVHKIHMGEELAKDGYNFGGVLFNEVTYPQDQRNCTKCHTASAATPQGDNWKNVPSRVACGGCHDGINFATGQGTTVSGATTGHIGGAKADDKLCAVCHTNGSSKVVPNGNADISAYHIPLKAPDPINFYLKGSPATCTYPACNTNTNASYVSSDPTNLPAGASVVTWDLASVTLNASAQPVFKFRYLVDGTAAVFNTYSATGKTEMLDNFVGGPSLYLAFSVPQDGINAPADFNASVSGYIKNIWRGTHVNDLGQALAATGDGTFTGPDASGYYTVVLTGVKIPTTATQMTGGMGYTYAINTTQPLTQTNVPGYAYNTDGKKQGGVSVPAPNVSKLISGTLPAGFATQTARRQVVETARCNTCHNRLGVFTSSAFHSGQRNDANTCSFCHNVNRANTFGWAVNQKDMVHAIHSADFRANSQPGAAKFSWEANSGDAYWKVTYPAILNNCEACHLPGAYDFTTSGAAAAATNKTLLWSYAGIGTIPATVSTIVTGSEPILTPANPTAPSNYYSPYVTPGAAYGAGYATNFATASTTPYTDAANTTLIHSPIAAACFGCHAGTTAQAHMRTNGGSIYAPRATALATTEACLVCHGTGKVADIKAVHMNVNF